MNTLRVPRAHFCYPPSHRSSHSCTYGNMIHCQRKLVIRAEMAASSSLYSKARVKHFSVHKALHTQTLHAAPSQTWLLQNASCEMLSTHHREDAVQRPYLFHCRWASTPAQSTAVIATAASTPPSPNRDWGYPAHSLQFIEALEHLWLSNIQALGTSLGNGALLFSSVKQGWGCPWAYG